MQTRARSRPTCRPATWPRSASPTSARPRWCGTGAPAGRYYNAIVWQDTRTDRIAAALERDGRGRRHPAQGRAAAGHVLLRRQDPVDPGERRRGPGGGRARRGGVRHHRQLAAVEPHRRRRRRRHVTDVTNASRTMLMDLETLDWDDELLGLFGIPRAMLPQIRPSSDPNGYGATVPTGAARRRDPAHRRPRRPAGGDGRPGLLRARRGQEHLRHRQLHAAQHRHRAGPQSSNGLLTTVCYQFGDADRRLRAGGLDRGHRLGGAVAARPARHHLRRRRESRRWPRQVEDNGGVYFVPAFSGLFAPYWRSDARGAIVGLSRFNTNAPSGPGHAGGDLLPEPRRRRRRWRRDSGRARSTCSRSTAASPPTSCACRSRPTSSASPVSRPVVAETTALGAAYAAGLAVGFWTDTDELRANWNESKRWKPQLERRAADGPGTPAGRRPSSARWTGSRSTDRLGEDRRADRCRTVAAGQGRGAGPDGRRSSSTCWSIGGGVVGRGLRAGRRHPRPAIALVEARDWASGTSSRSSKLIHGGLRYLEMLDFGLVREALRERGLLLDALAPAPGPAGAVPLPAAAPRSGSAPTSAPGCCSTTRWRPRRGRGAPAATPPAPHPARRAARSRRALRKDALIGAIQYYDAPGRRRPAHDDPRPHRGALTARWSPTGRGWSGSCARASGSPARASATSRPARELEVRAQQVINATGVWTDDTQALVGGPRAVPRAGVQGHPPGRAARPDPLGHRADPAHREERAVRHPVGPALDHRHHRHRLGRWTRPTRRPRASDIDYLLEHVNAVLTTPLTARGRRGRVRRAAAAAVRRVGVDLEAVPRARRRAPGAGAGRGRRRQVHDLPGDGQGRRRRGRARAGPDGARRRAPNGCRWSAPTAIAALWNRRSRSLAQRSGLHVARDRAPARPVRLADRRAARADRAPTRRSASRCRARTTTCASRRSTRAPTRARGTSTTCWPGAPGSRSRRGIGVSRPLARVAALMAGPCSAGDADVAERDRPLPRGCRPSGSRRSSPTTQTADAARLGAPDVRLDSSR